MVNYELPWNGVPFDGDVISFDTETTMVPDDSFEVPQLVLATASDGQRTVVIPRHLINRFVTWHQACVWVGFNWSFDYWVVDVVLGGNNGAWVNLFDVGQAIDLQILDQLIRLARGHGDDRRLWRRNLDQVAQEYIATHVDKKNPFRTRFGELLSVPVEQWPTTVDAGFFDYASDDAVVTWKLYEPMTRAARGEGQFQYQHGYLTERIQTKASIVLADVTRRGIKLDQEKVTALESDLRGRLTQSHGQMSLLAPGTLKTKKDGQVKVNSKSTMPELSLTAVQGHLADVAATEKVPVTLSAKTQKVVTSVDVWTNKLPDHPVVRTWGELSDVKKSFQFLQQLRGKDAVHPHYNTMVATGRTSAFNINVQQMPREPWFRAAFVARPGRKFIIADYNAIELRTLAAVCLAKFGESRLATAFEQNMDPHVFTAAWLQGMEYEEFQSLKDTAPAEYKRMRQAAKAVNFGVPGGLGAPKLAQHAKSNYDVNMTVDEARAFKAKLVNEVYPEIGRYLASDPLALVEKNTGVNKDTLRALWYGGKLEASLAAAMSASGENPEWQLWQMEKVIRGDPTTARGDDYPEWIINKTWRFLVDMRLYAGVPREVRERIDTQIQIKNVYKRGDSILHHLLFAEDAVTLTGRRRGRCKFTEVRNTQFQGLAADGAKLALWSLYMHAVDIVAFVHDEIVCEVDDNEVDVMRDRIPRYMNVAMEGVTSPVKSAVDVVVSDCWVKT